MLKIDQSALDNLPPNQQEEARELLAEYERQLRANPLLGFEPHDKQITFLSSREPVKAFLGGNRSGKTTAGIVDDLIQAVDRDCLPEHLKPFKRWEAPFHCRIITPDFTKTMEGVIFEKIREWAPKDQFVGGGFDKAYDKQLRKLHFKNGSTFDFMSFEQDLDKFGGAAKHRIHYDEEPPHDIRKESMIRLIDYGGDEIFTMTPLIGMSWMYSTIWEPYIAGTLEDSTVVVVDMDDNPHLDEETKKRALAGLSEEERKARKSGRFVHFAGMIYDCFEASRHVIPQKPVGQIIPPDALTYVGIDPGTRIMAAVLWAYLTPGDVMVVFEELALQGHTVEQVCDAIKLINLKHARTLTGISQPLVPQWYVIDPAARNVAHQTGRSDQMEYTGHGIVTIAGQNAVTPGINRIRERLETNRLLITANCAELLREIRRYRWKSPTRQESDPKEQPVKTDDHCFPAGTLVRTEHGERPIEQIKIGDRVWTRGGLCTVVSSAPTREAPMQTLVCSDGSELTGTEDHPFPVERDGEMIVTRLDALRYGDILLSCQSKHGTRAPRDAHGTSSTAARHGKTGLSSQPHANTAAASTSPCSPSGSAPTIASRPGDAPAASITRTEPARTAGPSFASTAIPGLATARVSVLSRRAATASTAYNLTVYGHSEFFANGLLVLNCLDALRYIVMSQPYANDPLQKHGNLSPLEERARLDQAGRRDPFRDIPKTPMGGIFV